MYDTLTDEDHAALDAMEADVTQALQAAALDTSQEEHTLPDEPMLLDTPLGTLVLGKGNTRGI